MTVISFPFVLAYDRGRFLRREHIAPGSAVYSLLPETEKAFREIAEPQAYYALPSSPLSMEGVSGGARILCAATLGEGISGLMQERTEAGHVTEAYLLSALADEALFALSEALCRKLREDFPALSSPLFPGDALPLPLQKDILDCFRRERFWVDITINHSFMLTPEKTMLWLFPAENSGAADTPCAVCSRHGSCFPGS